MSSSKFSLFFLFSAGFTLTFLEGTFGAESINLTLTIGSAFLKLTEALDLELFLLCFLSLLESLRFLFSNSVSIVTDNFQIFLTLKSKLLSLAIEGNFIGGLNLSKHLGVTSLLGLLCFDLSFLLFLDLDHHLLLFTFELLALLDALHLSVLDLLDDDGGTAALSFNSQALALFFGLQSLETLDLHHQVKTFLLGNPLFLKLLILFKLLVSDSNDLGIESHLVHVLDIVMLFIQLLLGLGEKTLSSLVLLNLDLSRWQLRTPVTVHGDHLLLAGLGISLLLCLLLLLDLPLLLGLTLGDDDGARLHARDVGSGDNSGATGSSLACLLNIGSHGTEIIIVDNCYVSHGGLCCRCYKKEEGYDRLHFEGA